MSGLLRGVRRILVADLVVVGAVTLAAVVDRLLWQLRRRTQP